MKRYWTVKALVLCPACAGKGFVKKPSGWLAGNGTGGGSRASCPQCDRLGHMPTWRELSPPELAGMVMSGQKFFVETDGNPPTTRQAVLWCDWGWPLDGAAV